MNTVFMETLKRAASVDVAMHHKPSGAPLWVSFTPTSKTSAGTLAFGFDPANEIFVRQETVGAMGKQWVMGIRDSLIWLLTIDAQANSYVVLHELANLEKDPIVLGKLPSRRTEPDFLLDRMIMSAMMVGSWKDGDGNSYQIRNDATALWKGAKREVQIAVDPRTNAVFLVLVDVRGNQQRFLAVRTGTILTLTGEDGSVTTLTLQESDSGSR